jgi:group II intron reverse transcriptase/maturase
MNKIYLEEKRRRKEARENLASEMIASFAPIVNILQGINRRSKTLVDSGKTNEKFKDLYSLLSNQNLLIQAYGNIQRNKGSLTPGVNLETIDEMSLKKIEKISNDIKNRNYKFKRLRRKWIEKQKLYKPSEKVKMRPLSVPTFSDRLVQEAIRMILEAIYEPVFEQDNMNFGFRPGKGCHHCITYLKGNGPNCNVAIEGDIDGAYDNVNQDILIKILEKRIQDTKFLQFLNEGFKSGILDNFKEVDTLTGVPQGGLASPILFNIYMHEFDQFIKNDLQKNIEEINKSETRTQKPRNPEYNKISTQITRLRNKYKKFKDEKKDIELSEEEKQKSINLQEQIRNLSKKRFQMPSLRNDKRKIKILYTRYADDFLILTNGKKRVAEIIKSEIGTFLKESLELNLSPTKTKITNLKIDSAKFLGFSIKTYNKRRLSLNKYGDFTKRAGWDLTIDIDADRLLDRLVLKGFSNLKRKPVAKKPWTVLQEEEIIKRYNYILRGIANYYFPVIDRYSYLNYVCYVLKFSCLSTFAKKYNSKITKITQKFGDPLTITVREKVTLRNNRQVENEKSFMLLTYPKLKEILSPIKFNWRDRAAIKNTNENVFEPMTTINWRTKRN